MAIVSAGPLGTRSSALYQAWLSDPNVPQVWSAQGCLDEPVVEATRSLAAPGAATLSVLHTELPATPTYIIKHAA